MTDYSRNHEDNTWQLWNDLRCLKIELGADLDRGVIRDTQLHYKERYFCAVK